jgi:hypothetical protein
MRPVEPNLERRFPVDRQNLIQRLVALKLQAANGKALCWAPSTARALCWAQAQPKN